uniref:Helicase ssl-1 n=1 Tax=Trichuris muris TaxID=70415 RepID=A0A5S6QLJ5_TRIMR
MEEHSQTTSDSCCNTEETQQPTTSYADSAVSNDTANANDDLAEVREKADLINLQFKELLSSVVPALDELETWKCNFSEANVSAISMFIDLEYIIERMPKPFLDCPIRCENVESRIIESTGKLILKRGVKLIDIASSPKPPPSESSVELATGSSLKRKRTSLDGEPSTIKIGSLNSEKDAAAAIRQEASILRRINELRQMGRWSQSLLPKCSEPRRLKSYWDNFIAETCWMSKDFAEERKLKKFVGKKMTAACSKALRDKSERARRLLWERAKQKKRMSSQENKSLRQLWCQVDKTVAYRNDAIIKAKREKALNAHLNIILGEPEKNELTTSSYADRSVGTESGVTGDQVKQVSSKDRRNASKDSSRKRHKHLDSAKQRQRAELADSFAIMGPSDQSPSRSGSSGTESSTSDSETVDTVQTEAEPAKMSDDWIDYGKLQSADSAERQGQLTCIAEAAEKLQPKGHTLASIEEAVKIPFLLKHTLREYQQVGLHWLITLNRKGLNGILADEMGLGKTIQTIALLAHLACENCDWGPHLVVVPTSVLLNWEMEFKKWCPSFKILTYYGHLKERKEKRRGWCKDNNFHICITSYKLVVQDYATFRRRKWHYMILDEAQNIKNFKSMRWQVLLNFNSTRRLLLTGTPLQNSLMELWSLMHFLMPNVFQSHSDFREWFSNPLTNMIDGSVEFDEQLVKRLHKVLRPFLLRRLKSEVERQLPKKFEHVMMCELSKRQRYLYNEFMSRSSTQSQLATGNVISVIGILMQLRKVCNHPNLFEPRPVVSPYWMPPVSWHVPAICCDMHLGSVAKVPVWLRSTSWRKLMKTECRTLDTLTATQKEAVLVSSKVTPSSSSLGTPRFYQCFRATSRENCTRLCFDGPNPKQFRAELSPLKQCKVPLTATTKVGPNQVKLSGAMKVSTSYIRANLKVNDGAKKEVLLRLVRKTPMDGTALPLDPSMPKLALPIRIAENGIPCRALPNRLPTLVNSQPPVLNSIHNSPGVSIDQSVRPCPPLHPPEVDFYGPSSSSPVCKKAKYDDSSHFSPSSGSHSSAPELQTVSIGRLSGGQRSGSSNVDIARVETEAPMLTESFGSLREAVRHLLESERANPWLECDLHVEEELKAMKEHVEYIGQRRAHQSATCSVGHLENLVIPKKEMNFNFRERLVAHWQYARDRAAIFVPGVCTSCAEPVISRRFPYEETYEATLKMRCQESLKNILQPYREFVLSRSLLFPESSLIEYDCGKLHVLASILRQLQANGHRCLIFTQMARMLDILEIFLNHHGYKYLRLDGATGVERRQVLMERFNEDRRILCFILSTRSGGLGVNLTGADTVIFYDSDWNPTMDAQAQDRCHRIGQTRDVNIYRLICARTVEENILLKANQKRKLGELAIEDGCFRPNFLRETIREMFNFSENNPPASNGESITDGELQQAMTCAEDDTDVVAAKVASAEATFDREEFEENEEAQDKQCFDAFPGMEPHDPEIAKVDNEMKDMLCELRPVERFGLMNLSSRRQSQLFEELQETEDEVEQYRRSFAESRKQELELEKSRVQDVMEEQFQLTYDAQDEHCKMIAEDCSIMPIWDPPTPPLSDSEQCFLTVDDDMWGPYLRTPMGELPLCVDDVIQENVFMAEGLPSPISPLQEKQSLAGETTISRPKAGEVPGIKANGQLSAVLDRGSVADSSASDSVLEPLTNGSKLSSNHASSISKAKKVTDDQMVCYLADRLLTPNHGGTYHNTNVNWDHVSEAMAALTNCSISPRQCLTRWESHKPLRTQVNADLNQLVCSAVPAVDLCAEATTPTTQCSTISPTVNLGAQFGVPCTNCTGIISLSSAKEDGNAVYPLLSYDSYFGIAEEQKLDYEEFLKAIREYFEKYRKTVLADASKEVSKVSRFEEIDEEAYRVSMASSMISKLTFDPSVGGAHLTAPTDTDADTRVTPTKMASTQSCQPLPTTTTQSYMINLGTGLDVLVSECSTAVGQPVDSSTLTRSPSQFMRVKSTQLSSRSAATGGPRREVGQRATFMPIIAANHSYQQSQLQVRPKPVLPQARMRLSAHRAAFTPPVQQHQRMRSPSQLSSLRHVSLTGQSPIPASGRPISIRSIRPRQLNTLMTPAVSLSEPRNSPPQLRSIPSINMIMPCSSAKSLVDEICDSPGNHHNVNST